jgi:hypothetical protein
MPDEIYRLAHVFRNHVVSIVIAVRTGKDNNAEFHSSISRQFGVRRQSEAATALWIASPAQSFLITIQSGVALRLPPHSKSLFNLHAKVFDNWIREYVVRHAHRFFPRLLSGLPVFNRNFEIFALTDIADTVIAE